MERDITVLIQPKKKKNVRIAPTFLMKSTNNKACNVIQKPPKPRIKERIVSSTLASSSIIPNVIIPKRSLAGYTDLANEVSFRYLLEINNYI